MFPYADVARPRFSRHFRLFTQTPRMKRGLFGLRRGALLEWEGGMSVGQEGRIHCVPIVPRIKNTYDQ